MGRRTDAHLAGQDSFPGTLINTELIKNGEGIAQQGRCNGTGNNAKEAMFLVPAYHRVSGRPHSICGSNLYAAVQYPEIVVHAILGNGQFPWLRLPAWERTKVASTWIGRVRKRGRAEIEYGTVWPALVGCERGWVRRGPQKYAGWLFYFTEPQGNRRSHRG